VRLDLPGVEKGKVQIEVDEDNVLQVKAKNSFQEPGDSLLREFRVGDNKEKISAKLENGLLEITVPKLEAVKPKRIEISA
jgi:HSP20 family protein